MLIRKVDENQAKIVEALRECGWSVLDLHMVGHDCPDLVVGKLGQMCFVEVKTEKGKLTKGQMEFMQKWRGHIVIGRTPEQTVDECEDWLSSII
jgi:Holliday junction resolvase